MGQMSSDNLSLKEQLMISEAERRMMVEKLEAQQLHMEKISEAYLNIEKELKIVKEDKTNLEQLKTDLSCLLQEKVVLEEKLHRKQKALRTLQMVCSFLLYGISVFSCIACGSSINWFSSVLGILAFFGV